MFLKLGLLWCFVLGCHGALWLLEEDIDAFIIDDTPESEVPDNRPNACKDSSGAHGTCVPFEECFPYHDLAKDNTSAPIGFLQSIDGSQAESCQPSPPPEEESNEKTTQSSAPSKYVCCTSFQYANAVKISKEVYLALQTNSSEPVPEIPVARPKRTGAVVNGEPATPGEFPFMVSISGDGGRTPYCGGSLLNSQWVLTAAHCFDNPNSRVGLLLRIGDHDLSSPSEVQHQERGVDKIFVHRGYNRQYIRNDVALLKLKTPVTPADNVRSIALHSGSPDLHTPPADCTVSGWGRTCDQICPLSLVLRKASLHVIPTAECMHKYATTPAPSGGRYPPVTSNNVCATGNAGSRADACQGDSGGPLFIIPSLGKMTQIGIVSWGGGCGDLAGVYTMVSSYVQWITNTMRNN